jgi:signal transduction histidine kinase
VRDVKTDMQSIYQVKHVHVEVHAAKGCEAEVDPPLLHEVLTNLLGNAIDAIGQGGRIDLEVLCSDGHAEIHVQDDGPGIPPSIRETLFQPFVTSKPQGTGLGLMICKRIVEAHGGRIEVEDGRARGARFVVKLPLKSPYARLSDR